MKSLAIVAVVATIIAGLVVLGPPSAERAHRLDERRMDDLRSLSNAVDLYRSRSGQLPASVNEASREIGDTLTWHDPVTGQPYPYKVVSADTYELCADFQQSSAAERHYQDVSFWSHPAGPRCFQFKSRSLPR
jgi:type II secretory pathway pseudopilin PulG